MRADCPDLEQLDQYESGGSSVSAALRDHVSACVECQARLVELAENQVLFNELSSAGGDLVVRLAPIGPPPPRIGDFDIVREVGRGGMGVVYEARQQHPRRRVALKVVRADYAASGDRARLFQREIRALARLRHEGIASIFESGASDGGPFYAMEFIEGMPLIEYARQRGLDLRQRLQLFGKLCAAISYAHQRGVIHRDLKPGNVLVEEGGALKVLDFGLARITDADVTCTSMISDAGRLAGTIAYMSPEQTRGVPDEIDLRSDVYSLGVILFELLAGTLPYEVSRTSVPAAIRSVCETAPRRPSLIVGAGGTNGRQIRGDLETIVLKALEKSPDARYQSVSALGEDIERYLANQPIVARPPSALYQLRKFARRNRVLVGGVIGVMVAMTIGVIGTTWQAWRARSAERQARAEAATHAEISRFMTNMFASVNPAADGHDVRVAEVLKRAAADIDGSFADQPRVVMALRDAIGGAYRSLTLYADAEPQYRAGLALARQNFGDDSRETLRFRYFLAETIAQNDKTDEADEELRATLADQTRLLGADDADTLMTRHFLAILTADRGKLDEAESLLRGALDGRTRALGPEHELTLESMHNLGILLRRQGKAEEGAALVRRAHEISLRVRGPDNPQTIMFAGIVATLASSPAELEAVEPTYRDLVERATRVFGPDHRQTVAFLESLAQLLELRCKYAEAESVARDLYERIKRARGERHTQCIDALARVARLVRMQERWDDAEPLARQVVALHREVHGEESVPTLDAIQELSILLSGAERNSEALPLIERAVAVKERVLGPTALGTTFSRTFLSEVLRKQGRLDESKTAIEKALVDFRAQLPADHGYIAWAECYLGTTLRDQKRFAEAEPLLLRASERLDALVGPCSLVCRKTKERIAELYRMWDTAEPGQGHEQQAAR